MVSYGLAPMSPQTAQKYKIKAREYADRAERNANKASVYAASAVRIANEFQGTAIGEHIKVAAYDANTGAMNAATEARSAYRQADLAADAPTDEVLINHTEGARTYTEAALNAARLAARNAKLAHRFADDASRPSA